MTKKIDSASVLYKRKSPPTFKIQDARIDKKMREVVANSRKLVGLFAEMREHFATESEFLEWLNEHDKLEPYQDAKDILEHVEATQ